MIGKSKANYCYGLPGIKLKQNYITTDYTLGLFICSNCANTTILTLNLDDAFIPLRASLFDANIPFIIIFEALYGSILILKNVDYLIVSNKI